MAEELEQIESVPLMAEREYEPENLATSHTGYTLYVLNDNRMKFWWYFVHGPSKDNSEGSAETKRVLRNRQAFQSILSSLFQEKGLPIPEYQSETEKQNVNDMFLGPVKRQTQKLWILLPEEPFARKNPSLQQFLQNGQTIADEQRPLIEIIFGHTAVGNHTFIRVQNVEPNMNRVLAEIINEALIRFLKSVKAVLPKANNLANVTKTMRRKRLVRKLAEKKFGDQNFGDPYFLNYFTKFANTSMPRNKTAKGGKRKGTKRSHKNKTARR